MHTLSAEDIEILANNRVYRGERTGVVFKPGEDQEEIAMAHRLSAALQRPKLDPDALDEFAALTGHWAKIKESQLRHAATELEVSGETTERARANLILDLAQEIIKRSPETPIPTTNFQNHSQAEAWEQKAEEKLAKCALSGDMTQIPALLRELAGEALLQAQNTSRRERRRRNREDVGKADPEKNTGQEKSRKAPENAG